MRAIVLEAAYGLDNLKLVNKPDPVPGPGQVVVDIKAASLNYRDLATVTAPSGRTPFVPCSDGAGVVSAIGEGVSRVKVGDHVATLFFQNWIAGDPTPLALGSALGGTLDGVLQDKMLLSEQGVTPVPAGYSDEEAATLPCAALTAWRGLVLMGLVVIGGELLHMNQEDWWARSKLIPYGETVGDWLRAMVGEKGEPWAKLERLTGVKVRPK